MQMVGSQQCCWVSIQRLLINKFRAGERRRDRDLMVRGERGKEQRYVLRIQEGAVRRKKGGRGAQSSGRGERRWTLTPRQTVTVMAGCPLPAIRRGFLWRHGLIWCPAYTQTQTGSTQTDLTVRACLPKNKQTNEQPHEGFRPVGISSVDNLTYSNLMLTHKVRILPLGGW